MRADFHGRSSSSQRRSPRLRLPADGPHALHLADRSKFVALFILLPAALDVACALIVVKLRPGGFDAARSAPSVVRGEKIVSGSTRSSMSAWACPAPSARSSALANSVRRRACAQAPKARTARSPGSRGRSRRRGPVDRRSWCMRIVPYMPLLTTMKTAFAPAAPSRVLAPLIKKSPSPQNATTARSGGRASRRSPRNAEPIAPFVGANCVPNSRYVK